jgi:uncharacterized membrane protein YkoI
MFKNFSKYLNYAHRYLGLIIFIQVILWSFSGFFMYFLDFSDLYVSPPEKPIDLTAKILSIPDIKNITGNIFPGEKIMLISLKNIAGKLFYNIKTDKKEFLINQEKQVLKIVPEEMIKIISSEKYTGKGKIQKIELIEKSKGNYYSDVPIYRVTYDDKQKSELFINPGTGELLAKRKALWGFYNTMWEYHLMKYTPSSGLNKKLLLFSAVISLFVSITGFLKFFKSRTY